MKSIRKLFRRSLFLKVFSLSAIVSILVIYVVGSTLYNRIRDGIFEEKIAAAISEGRAAIQFTEFRFNIASLNRGTNFAELTKELVSSTNVSAEESGREVALFNFKGQKVDGIPSRITSNFLKYSSIPQVLRDEVRSSGGLVWARGNLEYVNGRSIPGIFIGRVIDIPERGRYEVYVGYDFVAQQSSVDLTGRALWGTGILLVALILLTASLVLRIVIKPVQIAAEVAESLTSGNLERRMQVTGEDEIARLGNAFNQMAETVSNQINRLENLSRVQQRFVSDVSHELRTPLTTIRMASDVIFAERDKFDPVVARSAELLVSQIERFELLLQDLLEVSRFDAQVAALTPTRIDISTAIKQAISDTEFLAKEKAVVVNLELPDEVVALTGDARRLGRILRNLLSNAIEHSEGKPIDVKVRQNEDAVAVSVRDYGIGIDRQYWSRVFDRFWRADPSRARIRGGTGLGLSIAREDAQLHGGEIRVWGESNKGANFVLTLPKAPGAALEEFPISEFPTADVITP